MDYGLPSSEYLGRYIQGHKMSKPGPGRWLLTGPNGDLRALSFQLERPNSTSLAFLA